MKFFANFSLVLNKINRSEMKSTLIPEIYFMAIQNRHQKQAIFHTDIVLTGAYPAEG